jgi:hypothetical protein
MPLGNNSFKVNSLIIKLLTSLVMISCRLGKKDPLDGFWHVACTYKLCSHQPVSLLP